MNTGHTGEDMGNELGQEMASLQNQGGDNGVQGV